ncbi:MAG TPA: 50S ribosomal protein L35 [Bacillota bacterium]|nr:50S ribosomal protein L35 [Bacillota bacterium]HPE38732.1 50S ribosomal protein L35 [Bacillota bacterium]
MPKQKTHSSSKKRFKVTGTGKVLYSQAFRRHILSKRPTKRMRHLRHAGVCSAVNARVIKKMIPYK